MWADSDGGNDSEDDLDFVPEDLDFVPGDEGMTAVDAAVEGALTLDDGSESEPEAAVEAGSAPRRPVDIREQRRVRERELQDKRRGLQLPCKPFVRAINTALEEAVCPHPGAHTTVETFGSGVPPLFVPLQAPNKDMKITDMARVAIQTAAEGRGGFARWM